MPLLQTVFGGESLGATLMLIVFGLAAALILLFWTFRKLAGPQAWAAARHRKQPRLAVLEAAAIDSKRRMLLVRRDNVEHLVMIGGTSDFLIEGNIIALSAQGDDITLDEIALPVRHAPVAEKKAPADAFRAGRPASPGAIAAGAPKLGQAEPVAAADESSFRGETESGFEDGYEAADAELPENRVESRFPFNDPADEAGPATTDDFFMRRNAPGDNEFGSVMPEQIPGVDETGDPANESLETALTVELEENNRNDSWSGTPANDDDLHRKSEPPDGGSSISGSSTDRGHRDPPPRRLSRDAQVEDEMQKLLDELANS
jgi:hypothetical protein